MTRRRWIADEVSGDQAALTGNHADHLIRVLRARLGQEFDISAGETVRRGRVVSITNDRVDFELGDVISTAAEIQVTLLLAIFKFDRMEWAIEKCTELGVTRIVPVIARRSDAHLATASRKRFERWQRISRQASEQSRRTSPPEIVAPVKLPDALHVPAGLRIVLSESENLPQLREIIEPDVAIGGVALAVGPEGGWTEDELKLFAQVAWTPASLGNTILRAETAAIAATAIVVSTLSTR